MQDLLRATGVSSSSLYHFFPDGKEQLIATAVREHGLDAAERIASVFEKFDAPEAIRRIFDAAAAEMKANSFTLGCAIGVPATEAPSDSPAIQQVVSEVFEAWAKAYERGLNAAGLDHADAESLGRAIVAAYQGAVTLARATRSVAPYDDARTLIMTRLTS